MELELLTLIFVARRCFHSEFACTIRGPLLDE